MEEVDKDPLGLDRERSKEERKEGCLSWLKKSK